MRRRLAVGDHQDDRLGIGVPAQVTGRPASARAAGWCPGSTPARPRPARPGVSRRASRLNPMTCSASCRKRRLDQVAERQRGLLHRTPAAVLHHRERQVDAERHRRAGAPLGLGHLEVLDGEGASWRRALIPSKRRARPKRVPERRKRSPRSARASIGSSSPNTQGRVSPVCSSAEPVRWSSWSPCPVRLDLGEDPLQRGLAQPAYGSGGEPEPVVGRAADSPAAPARAPARGAPSSSWAALRPSRRSTSSTSTSSSVEPA